MYTDNTDSTEWMTFESKQPWIILWLFNEQKVFFFLSSSATKCDEVTLMSEKTLNNYNNIHNSELIISNP